MGEAGGEGGAIVEDVLGAAYPLGYGFLESMAFLPETDYFFLELREADFGVDTFVHNNPPGKVEYATKGGLCSSIAGQKSKRADNVSLPFQESGTALVANAVMPRFSPARLLAVSDIPELKEPDSG
jgi:hypothetical protein